MDKRKNRITVAAYVAKQEPKRVRESKSDLRIIYEGKKPEADILSRKPTVQLQEVASYGQVHLHKAPNLLV